MPCPKETKKGFPSSWLLLQGQLIWLQADWRHFHLQPVFVRALQFPNLLSPSDSLMQSSPQTYKQG